jgi:hypothetical protein
VTGRWMPLDYHVVVDTTDRRLHVAARFGVVEVTRAEPSQSQVERGVTDRLPTRFRVLAWMYAKEDAEQIADALRDALPDEGTERP